MIRFARCLDQPRGLQAGRYGERPGWLASTTKLAQVGRFVFLTRRPVEQARKQVSRDEPPSEPATPVKADSEADESDQSDRKMAAAPRQPLSRREPGSNEASASKPTRAAETWITGGQ